MSLLWYGAKIGGIKKKKKKFILVLDMDIVFVEHGWAF